MAAGDDSGQTITFPAQPLTSLRCGMQEGWLNVLAATMKANFYTSADHYSNHGNVFRNVWQSHLLLLAVINRLICLCISGLPQCITINQFYSNSPFVIVCFVSFTKLCSILPLSLYINFLVKVPSPCIPFPSSLRPVPVTALAAPAFRR